MRNCPLFCSNFRDESENTKHFEAKQGEEEVTVLSSEGITSVPSGCGLQASALLVIVKECLSEPACSGADG
jgi:hypothetical protein